MAGGFKLSLILKFKAGPILMLMPRLIFICAPILVPYNNQIVPQCPRPSAYQWFIDFWLSVDYDRGNRSRVKQSFGAQV